MDYHFKAEIEEQLLPFEQYMQEKCCAEGTIKQMRNYVGTYLRFVHRMRVEVETHSL